LALDLDLCPYGSDEPLASEELEEGRFAGCGGVTRVWI
jgi:hypothetical protein